MERRGNPFNFASNSDGMLASMSFEHPKVKTTTREGKWDVGDGERQIRFDDGREPSEYFLIKRGLRFAFQTKAGLSNDDGSPVLLIAILVCPGNPPIRSRFLLMVAAMLRLRVGSDLEMKGQWNWAGSSIVVSAKLPAEENSIGQDQDLETYKYFLQWDEKKTEDLLLEKMVVMRPFRKDDGAKRQSWMSSLSLTKSPDFLQLLLSELQSNLLSKV